MTMLLDKSIIYVAFVMVYGSDHGIFSKLTLWPNNLQLIDEMVELNYQLFNSWLYMWDKSLC